jgi:hypothetical protein
MRCWRSQYRATGGKCPQRRAHPLGTTGIFNARSGLA